MSLPKLCTVEDCSNPRKGRREWCAKHIERWRRYGDPEATKARTRGTCSIAGCDQPNDARSMCAVHYTRWRRNSGLPATERVRYDAEATCSVDECSRPPVSRGWCGLHRQRWEKHGDPTAVTWRNKPAEERLRDRVTESPTGCWELLQGGLNSSGYAWHSVNGHHVLAHRFSYEAFVGPIPDGYDIDHLCRNRVCCNPAHLEPVTRAENLRRAREANRKGVA